MRLMILAALAGIACVAPAAAQEPTTGPETSAPATVAPAPEKKICRTYATTGSILGGKRTCHTKSEWTQIDHDSEAANDRFRNGRDGRTGGKIE